MRKGRERERERERVRREGERERERVGERERERERGNNSYIKFNVLIAVSKWYTTAYQTSLCCFKD